MKTSVKTGSENYTCTVVEIKDIFPIEGADRIVRTTIFNNDVIISKDVKVGDVMLYFCSGTKLNEDFCKYNNLLTDAELNRDKTKGYISHKQFRVKAIRIRGVISDGILLPLESLAFLGTNTEIWEDLNVGGTFTDILGVSLCEKYFVPVRNSGQGKQKKSSKVSRLVDKQFYFHNDTDNFRRNAHKIQPDDIIGIHYKKHGTSVIISNIQVKRNLNWFERGLKFLGAKLNETEYDIVYASRRVVKNMYLNTNPNSYYKTDIWSEAKEEVKDKIPKNWTIYGEILGYTKDGGKIQGEYDYGCQQGEHKFYVYRITVVNPDGIVVELSDQQIKEFCNKNGLLFENTFIYHGKAKDLFPELNIEIHWNESFLLTLEEKFNEKDCWMCVNKVPEEGIVIRKESMYHYEAYKLKSKRFVLKESESQEKEEVNIEDNQEENGITEEPNLIDQGEELSGAR